MPSNDQIASIIRLLLGAGGPLAALLVSKGATADQVNQILTIALAVGPPLVSLVWGLSRHTNTGNAIAASTLPGVTVTVDPAKSTPALVAVANDPTNAVKKV